MALGSSLSPTNTCLSPATYTERTASVTHGEDAQTRLWVQEELCSAYLALCLHHVASVAAVRSGFVCFTALTRGYCKGGKGGDGSGGTGGQGREGKR